MVWKKKNHKTKKQIKNPNYFVTGSLQVPLF